MPPEPDDDLFRLRRAAADYSRIADDYNAEGLTGVAQVCAGHAVALWHLASARDDGRPRAPVLVCTCSGDHRHSPIGCLAVGCGCKATAA